MSQQQCFVSILFYSVHVSSNTGLQRLVIALGRNGGQGLAVQYCLFYTALRASQFIISLIRMRSKRDIKMGRLCTPGGAVLGIVGGGVTFRF